MGKRPRPTALWDYKHHLGRVAHFVRNPALPTDQPLRGRWANGMNINIGCYKFVVIPNSYIIRELGIRYDVFLSKIRQNTNGYLTNYRVAVGLLVGQGCERSELPCLADEITKQGRRSWFFYIYRSCRLVDRRIWGQMLLTNDIVFIHWFTSNR